MPLIDVAGPQGSAGDVALVFEFNLASQSLSKLAVRRIKNSSQFKSASSAKIVAYRKAGTSAAASLTQARAMATQIRLSYPAMKVTARTAPGLLKDCKPVCNQCVVVLLSK